jgi:hypothetical protein
MKKRKLFQCLDCGRVHRGRKTPSYEMHHSPWLGIHIFAHQRMFLCKGLFVRVHKKLSLEQLETMRVARERLLDAAPNVDSTLRWAEKRSGVWTARQGGKPNP